MQLDSAYSNTDISTSPLFRTIFLGFGDLFSNFELSEVPAVVKVGVTAFPLRAFRAQPISKCFQVIRCNDTATILFQ